MNKNEDEPGDLERIDRIRRDFVANASHELRTPLTVLRGYLDMMNDEAAVGGPLAPWHDPLDNMCQQAERMEQIISDMLTLARLEVAGAPARTERVDVPAMLDKIGRQAESMSQGRHEIRFNAEAELCLLAHAADIENAFSNLVFNAIQHTPPGTHVDVSWQRAEDGVLLVVSDDGPGIPAKDIPRLTERFYRVDVGRSRASGGTGLGLAIVKHALERNGGRLEISSRPGEGAVFRCRFSADRLIAQE